MNREQAERFEKLLLILGIILLIIGSAGLIAGSFTANVVYDIPTTEPYQRVVIDVPPTSIISGREALGYPYIKAQIDSAEMEDMHDSFASIVSDINSSDSNVGIQNSKDDAKGFIEMTALITSPNSNLNLLLTDWYNPAEAIAPLCGDENIDPGEECDPPESPCTPPYNGNCTYCNASCQNVILYDGYCGNGIVEGAEVCDSSNLANQTCKTQGFNAGTLLCLSNCSGFDTRRCLKISTGGGGGTACLPVWNCTSWSPCTPEGYMYRTCTDGNCYSDFNKPSERSRCNYAAHAEEAPNVTEQVPEEVPEVIYPLPAEEEKPLVGKAFYFAGMCGWFCLILLILGIMAIVLSIILHYRHKEKGPRYL